MDKKSKQDEDTEPLSLEDWQLREIQAGIADLDAGRIVSHEKMKAWLNSWGTPEETEPPQCADT